jgi:sigma-B regulation protein RsbU (phosphoserine phosphatase)
VTVHIKTVWKRLGKLDKAFLILLLIYIVLLLLVPANFFLGLLELVLFVLGAWLLLRLTRIGLRKAIWRLRNRILVTYVLIAVVPILLILTLAGLGTWVLAGQMAVYLARSELDRRVASMQAAVETLLHTNPMIRVETLRRTGEIYGERFPRLLLMIDDHGNLLHWPAEPAIRVAPKAEETSSGVAVHDGRFYAWAQISKDGMRFIAATPLTRRYLSEMVPGFGDIYLVQVSADRNKEGIKITNPNFKRSGADYGDQKVELLPSGREAPGPALPPPVNSFDLDVRWIYPLPVKDWLVPERTDTALMVVRTRYSAILNIILSQKVDLLQGLIPIAFLVVSIAFLVVELIALIIGVSLTRTITGAVHSLYEGTQRVMKGDFSHRISVSGRDQLADLSKSFNSMTENLEKLLIVAKEKERLQAELALALEVQEQLYPKTAPIFKTIRVTGMCQPARMVSGDYYDYQKLSPNRLAFAIGDVAGKGISAALLMAGIQSAMRMELRASFEIGPGEIGTEPGPPSARANGFRLSTARLVSELNQQLHATTSPEKFATFCIALYDDETGMLTYTNAGHLPPILIHNGTASPLDINGTVVGAFPSSKYDESKVELRAGDLLVCYTDGITEPENEYGEMFGEDRLIELVSKNADRDDHRLIEVVMDAVRQWTGSPELSDDMTVLLARKQ